MQNDMRDRLIELLEQAEGQVNNDIPSLESIADYLIANGVIVLNENQIVIERKMVYFPFPIDCEKCSKATKEHENVCEDLELLYLGKHPKYNEKEDWKFMCENCPHEIYEREYKEDDENHIGKTVFLTKEEAEQKLKKMRVEIIKSISC